MNMKNNVKNGVYIIAEAGQNHNGEFEKAKALIDIACLKIGHGKRDNIFSANAIKFTKRDMTDELTAKEYQRPYSGHNSYGRTYGLHREALELSYEEHFELFLYAKTKGLDFIETICSITALQLLRWFKPDFIKVASRDMDNYPLLDAIGTTKIPVILSSGMSDFNGLVNSICVISKYHRSITILHCVSQYPAEYENINLRSISFLKNICSANGEFVIGYSDHTAGVLAPAIAVAYGAQVIEKHITYNKQAKGTDHQGSMDHEGFARCIRDIRNTELSCGEYAKTRVACVNDVQRKLRRRVCAGRNLEVGQIIKKSDLVMLSENTDSGFLSCEAHMLIGRKVKKFIWFNTLIRYEDIKD